MTEYHDKKDTNLTSIDIETAVAICNGTLGQCMTCPLFNSPAVCTEVFARYIIDLKGAVHEDEHNT